MIASFGDRGTADLYHARSTARARRIPPDVADTALRKLDVLEAALNLDDLRSPPGNRLEALQGNLAGWHSVRVNVRWRLIFRWEEDAAHDVMLVDYH